MCCSLVSVKKNFKKDKFVHLRNVEEEFRSRDQMTTSHNTRQHFALSRAHSRTDGPEVTVIYTGRNLKPNTFRLVLKENSMSIGLDNGSEEKNYRVIYFFCSYLEWRAIYLWL